MKVLQKPNKYLQFMFLQILDMALFVNSTGIMLVFQSVTNLLVILRRPAWTEFSQQEVGWDGGGGVTPRWDDC